MGAADLVLLRHVAASQGLMLESTAEGLMQPGGAHWGCPDKEPSVRLATIEAAGELVEVGAARIPFTNGLLVGIGESRADRIRDLLTLRDLHSRYGHIQEMIIQPFRAKEQTRMEGAARIPSTSGLLVAIGGTGADRLRDRLTLRVLHSRYGHIQEMIIQPFRAKEQTRMEGDHAAISSPHIQEMIMQPVSSLTFSLTSDSLLTPSLPQPFRAKGQTRMGGWGHAEAEELLWSVAVARIVFGAHMSIQSPPNLSVGDVAQSALIAAGINDWGGISPVTVDWVNPEVKPPSNFPLPPSMISHPSSTSPTFPPSILPPIIPVPLPQATFESTQKSLPLPLPPSIHPPPNYPGSASPGPVAPHSRASFSHCSFWEGSRASPASLPQFSVIAQPGHVAGEYGDTWLDPLVLQHVLQHSDSSGYARCEQWAPGTLLPLPPGAEGLLVGPAAAAAAAEGSAAVGDPEAAAVESREISGRGCIAVGADGLLTGTDRRAHVAGDDVESTPSDKAMRMHDVARASDDVARILERALQGRTLSEHAVRMPSHPNTQQAEIVRLFSARGTDFHAVCRAADGLRAVVSGDEVSYVVNRNINYTNVCTYACQFCAFSMSLEEISSRAKEAWERGATEGGIHPDFTGETYVSILSAVKAACPDMHVHAFSPLEVWHGATSLNCRYAYVTRLPDFTGGTYLSVLSVVKAACPDMHVQAFSPLEVWHGATSLNCSVPHFLKLLKSAGLGSLPGTAAEILDDSVRAVLCPDKISTVQWREVIEAAHSVGLPTTSTIMFGHVDHPIHWARHLLLLRSIQERTGGITEFVPLPFVHMQAFEAPQKLRATYHPYPPSGASVPQGQEQARPHVQRVCTDARCASVSQGQQQKRSHIQRVCADACSGAAGAASTHYEHPGLMGEDGIGGRFLSASGWLQ
ncbi:unnamed protein product [Closterium sp. Naga37s-1]|nr:unnamed protein product [Closterium sp. Naga37s-1]